MRRALLAIGLAAAAAGTVVAAGLRDGEDGGAAARTPRAEEPRVVVVGPDHADAPPGCTVHAVALALGRHSAALSGGDVRAAVREFAAEPAFQWYSATASRGRRRPPIHTVVYNAGRLRSHLARRVRQREQLAFTVVRVGYMADRERSDFEVSGTRTARDLRRAGARARQLFGKGSVGCADGRVAVLSLATNARALGVPCPGAVPRSDGAIIACAS